jgi:uncharacterized membrane protein
VKEKVTGENNSQKDSTLFAFLGIFLTIIGFLIVKLTRPEDKYAMHYAKQGLVFGVIFISCYILQIVPLIGLIAILAGLVTFVLWIIGIVYSFSGKQKDVPIIGGFAKKI